jgi:hypothetical protein
VAGTPVLAQAALAQRQQLPNTDHQRERMIAVLDAIRKSTEDTNDYTREMADQSRGCAGQACEPRPLHLPESPTEQGVARRGGVSGNLIREV